MAIARALADILTAVATENDYEDVDLAETPLYEAVPVHYVVRASGGRNGAVSTTTAEGQTTTQAQVRIPARYVITAGMIVVLGDYFPGPETPPRWRVIRVLPSRQPGRWSIAICEKIE